MADDREVLPAARRLEIAVVGRDADTRPAVDRIGRGAGSLRRVVVLAPAVAERDRGILQRAVDPAPIGDGRAIDRDRAAVAMIGRGTEIDVGLEPVEVRQDVLPAPATAAQRTPALEIIGHAADGDLAVDGRAAAHRTATPQELRLLPLGAARQKIGPTIIVVGDRPHGIGNADVFGRLGRAEIASGLEQEHPDAGSSLNRAASTAPADPAPTTI